MSTQLKVKIIDQQLRSANLWMLTTEQNPEVTLDPLAVVKKVVPVACTYHGDQLEVHGEVSGFPSHQLVIDVSRGKERVAILFVDKETCHMHTLINPAYMDIAAFEITLDVEFS